MTVNRLEVRRETVNFHSLPVGTEFFIGRVRYQKMPHTPYRVGNGTYQFFNAFGIDCHEFKEIMPPLREVEIEIQEEKKDS